DRVAPGALRSPEHGRYYPPGYRRFPGVSPASSLRRPYACARYARSPTLLCDLFTAAGAGLVSGHRAVYGPAIPPRVSSDNPPSAPACAQTLLGLSRRAATRHGASGQTKSHGAPGAPSAQSPVAGPGAAAVCPDPPPHG